MKPIARPDRNAATDPEAPRSPPADPIVYFIDPRPLTRECISHALQSIGGFRGLVAMAASETAPEPSSAPDLLILNLGNQPLGSPPADRLIRTVTHRFLDVPYIIMGDLEASEIGYEAIRLGARGYIHNFLALSVAAAALRLVLAGGTFVPGPTLPTLSSPRPLTTDWEHAPQLDIGVATLTPRELDVLKKLERGKTNRQIAAELNMRESTVKSHIRQIKHKTRLSGRVELALKAHRLLSQSSR